MPSGSAGAPTTFAYTGPGTRTPPTPSSATCTCHTRSWTYPPTPAWPWSPTAPTPEPPPTTPYGSLPAGPPPTTQPTPWHDHRRPNPPGQGRPETGDPHSDTRSCRAADSGAFRGWVVPGQRSSCGVSVQATRRPTAPAPTVRRLPGQDTDHSVVSRRCLSANAGVCRLSSIA